MIVYCIIQLVLNLTKETYLFYHMDKVGRVQATYTFPAFFAVFWKKVHYFPWFGAYQLFEDEGIVHSFRDIEDPLQAGEKRFYITRRQLNQLILIPRWFKMLPTHHHHFEEDFALLLSSFLNLETIPGFLVLEKWANTAFNKSHK